MARPVRNYTTILRNYINLAADKTAADIMIQTTVNVNGPLYQVRYNFVLLQL